MHYAFIIQGNKLVEWAPNRTHDPDKYLGYPDYAKLHAETLAYKRAKGLLKKNQPFEVVNIRLGKSGELRNSMPCPCCARWMRALGCRQLLFSVDAGFAIFPL